MIISWRTWCSFCLRVRTFQEIISQVSRVL